MEIIICGQREALELISNIQVTTSVISIIAKEDQPVVFPDHPSLVSVLPLQFNDLTEAFDEEGIPYGRALPVQEDFAGLKDFVKDLSCECLIVHCWEGTSRSAAVAKAIYEFRGRRDELNSLKQVSPNPLVYALAARELTGSGN